MDLFFLGLMLGMAVAFLIDNFFMYRMRKEFKRVNGLWSDAVTSWMDAAYKTKNELVSYQALVKTILTQVHAPTEPTREKRLLN